LSRGALRQTPQDVDSEAVTTVAEAVVLLLAGTDDRVLSSMSSIITIFHVRKAEPLGYHAALIAL